MICRSFLHGVSCSEAVVNVSDKARADCAFPTAITSRSRILLLDRPPLPALSQGSPRELSLLQGWCLFSPRGFVLFVPFCFWRGKPCGAKRAIPPGIDRRHGTFSWDSAICCCCCGCRSSPCALPVPPGTLTRRFEYTWTDTSTSRLAANCPQNGCRSFLSSNVGPGCSSRFYAPARVGVSAPLLCRGR